MGKGEGGSGQAGSRWKSVGDGGYPLRVRVVPLASESWPGVRSASVLVETPEAKVLIDPGCALGPRRYGLPPHRLEIEALSVAWGEIKKALEDAQIVIITHYHYDHFNPHHPELLRGKLLLVKHPERDINKSQRARAAAFLEELSYTPADKSSFRVGGLDIVFSGPLPHGREGTRVGWVLSVALFYGDHSFLYTSDVSGLQTEEQLRFILEMKPKVIYIDGPLTYMPKSDLGLSMELMGRMVEEAGPVTVILEHHLLRDLRWRERVAPFLELARARGVRVLTAAAFAGREERLLEARRRELYAKTPPQ